LVGVEALKTVSLEGLLENFSGRVSIKLAVKFQAKVRKLVGIKS
jgi:hypothetical protein